MKIKILLLTLITAFSVCFFSCGLVEYKEYIAPPSEELISAVEDYSAKLDEFISPDEYYTDDYHELKVLIQDAKNELNECVSVEKVDEIYDKHLELLTKVPTAKDRTKDKLNSYIVFSNYRKEEQAGLKTLLNDYLLELENESTVTEVEVLFSVFKTQVGAFKTDAEYYGEELSALKNQLKQELLVIDYSLYRTAERVMIEEICLEYDATMSTISVKEVAIGYHAECMEKISLLKTDQELSTLGAAETVEKWREKFAAYTNEFNSTDRSKIDQTLENTGGLTVREIEKKCSLLLIELSIEVGDSALEYLKYGVVVYTENCATLTDYRSEQQSAVLDLQSSIDQNLKSADTTQKVVAVLDGFNTSFAAIPTNDQLWEKEDDEFFTRLSTLYGTAVLDAPKSLTEANDYTELAQIIDYYAFYQLDFTTFLRNTFRVKLNFSIKDAQYEINEVYWYAELLRSAVGITGYFEENSTNLVITLVPYALATESNTSSPREVSRHKNLVSVNDGNATLTDRAADFNDFPYLNKYTKTLNGVWNSQQVWYALEHEYIPVPVKGSAAEKVLERAKEILRDIIKDGMTDEQKVLAIFNWFAKNVTYDGAYTKYLHPENRTFFPDELAATLNSFNAEGALFENFAVCCSYAKSYLILLRLEGIESYRITLRKFTENAMVDPYNKSGYGSHAIVAIKMSDGKFYYSDVEESYINSTIGKIHQFAVTQSLDYAYSSGYTRLFPELEYGTTLPNIVTEKLSYQGTSVYIKTQTQLEKILTDFNSQTETGVQISVFEQDDLSFSISNILESASVNYHTFSFGGLKEYIIYK